MADRSEFQVVGRTKGFLVEDFMLALLGLEACGIEYGAVRQLRARSCRPHLCRRRSRRAAVSRL